MIPQILIVEDDADLREYLREFLTQHGYVVRVVDDGVKAIEMVEKLSPDLMILDMNLPTLKGDAVCREVKKMNPEVKVIILTANDTTNDLVKGFTLGADDYMKKPFDIDELLARIKSRLKQSKEENGKLTIADLEYDPKAMVVKRGDRQIQLTPQEIKILDYLITNKGQVLTREMILSRLWKTNPDIDTRVVDVYIGYLRKKIDADSDLKLIHSVRGFGYKLCDNC